MMAVEANWLREAYQLMKERQAPGLAEVLARPLNELGAEDMLVAHALAAYLIEGQSERVKPLLLELTAKGPAAAAFEKVLGWPLADLQARLERWVGELP
jgi:hypothetical protein